MSPKVKAAKEQLLSPGTVITLLLAVAGGGGGAVLGKNVKSEADANLAYRLEQLEKQVAASKESELDKRLTRLEDAQGRIEKTVDKLDDIVQNLPANRR